MQEPAPLRLWPLPMAETWFGATGDDAAMLDLGQQVIADLHRPTATDPSLAPEGSDAFYVLSPVPHLDSGVDWEVERERYREKVAANQPPPPPPNPPHPPTQLPTPPPRPPPPTRPRARPATHPFLRNRCFGADTASVVTGAREAAEGLSDFHL